MVNTQSNASYRDSVLNSSHLLNFTLPGEFALKENVGMNNSRVCRATCFGKSIRFEQGRSASRKTVVGQPAE